jgi:enoyl-CoA hydratase
MEKTMAGSARLEVADKIATVTIRNEGRLNAIDISMAKDLARISSDVSKRTDINVVVMRGDGTRAFCAGMDLKYAQSTGNQRQAFDDIDIELDQAEAHFCAIQVPVIAALRGACFGGGLILAAWADMRIAADDLKLGVPAIANQLFYPIPALQRLEDIVGLNRVQHLLYDGLPIPTSTLLAWGLIDQVFPEKNFEEMTMAFLQRVANRSRDITMTYKKIFSSLRRGDAKEAEALRISGLDVKE